MAIGTLVAFADPVRARTNIQAWNLINQVNSLNREIAIRQLRLATGRQQPRVEDGASFFAIWNKMKNQVRGKTMAMDNIGDAKDELSLAESGLLQVDDLLGRMRDLIVRAGNDTLTSEQREDIRQEILSLYNVITNLVKRTRFNEGGAGEDPLLGGFHHTYQVGPNETALDQFTVAIPNILIEVTKLLSPELGAKAELLVNTLSGISDVVREKIAAEIHEFGSTLPAGNVNKAIAALETAFAPNGQIADFLKTVSQLNPEEASELNQQLATLFTARLDTAATNPPFVNFLTDAEVLSQFSALPSLLGDLLGDSTAMATMANGLQQLAGSGEIQNSQLAGEIQDLAKVLLSFDEGIQNLDAQINQSLGSDTQRFFVAQDIAFYASNSTTLANQANVQQAMLQLANDIYNHTTGLPNFTQAVSSLTPAERNVLKTALQQVASDPVNGLAFHVAVPDLDGSGGPFAVGANSFTQTVLNITERTQEPATTDNNLSTILLRVAEAIRGRLPNVATRINTVVSLLNDNNDANDSALASALTALGGQIESDTQEDKNFASILQGAATALASRFPSVSSRLNSLAQLILNGANDTTLAQAVSSLGADIETSTGTSVSFTNPIDRAAVQAAFIAQANTPAFQNLSTSLQNAFVNMVNALIGTVDLNGTNGPLAQAIARIDPTSSASLAIRSPIQEAILSQVNSAEFQALSPFMKEVLVDLAESLTQSPNLTATGAPFSAGGINTFAQTVVNLKETSQTTSLPDDTDDVNLATLLQAVSNRLSTTAPGVTAAINQVIGLLADNSDTNDVALANALTNLGAQIESATGGQNHVNGAARAEIRRAFLEPAGGTTFRNLSVPMQVAYLTMAEAIGAYAADQISGLDARLEAVGAATASQTSTLQTELAQLANAIASESVSGSDRDAFIQTLSSIAESLGALEPASTQVQALRDAIDNPENDTQPNPDDLVGILSRYLTGQQQQALQDLFVQGTVGGDWTSAAGDFLRLTTHEDANELLAGVDAAVNAVKDQLINLGGIQTKLTSLENLLSTSITAEDSVASRFGDADLAKEQVELAKLNLFSQLASAQAASANLLPTQIISALLGGQ
jgi:flagellin